MRNSLDDFLNKFDGQERYLCFSDSTPLMFITHRTDRYTELDEVKMVLEGGCTWVQLRMKDNLNLQTAQEVSKYIKLQGFCTNILCRSSR
jgi:thiamine-phosphate pyrophosphorylase